MHWNVTVVLYLASALKAHLRGKGCLVVMADVKVEVSQSEPKGGASKYLPPRMA